MYHSSNPATGKLVANTFVYLHVALTDILVNFTFMLLCIVIDLLLNNQPDTLIIQIYSVIKLYMFRASSLPIVRSFLLYTRHW